MEKELKIVNKILDNNKNINTMLDTIYVDNFGQCKRVWVERDNYIQWNEIIDFMKYLGFRFCGTVNAHPREEDKRKKNLIALEFMPISIRFLRMDVMRKEITEEIKGIIKERWR